MKNQFLFKSKENIYLVWKGKKYLLNYKILNLIEPELFEKNLKKYNMLYKIINTSKEFENLDVYTVIHILIEFKKIKLIKNFIIKNKICNFKVNYLKKVYVINGIYTNNKIIIKGLENRDKSMLVKKYQVKDIDNEIDNYLINLMLEIILNFSIAISPLCVNQIHIEYKHSKKNIMIYA